MKNTTVYTTYKKANLEKVVKDNLCKHIPEQEQNALPHLLFDVKSSYGTLGAWQEELVTSDLKSCHDPPFSIPRDHHKLRVLWYDLRS